MLLGVIADDFTGASDIANTLAKGLTDETGMRTAQFNGVPQTQAPDNIEAGVIALKTRSAPVQHAVDTALDALRWLRVQGCQQIVFKYCSTFDSTQDGNIGPVAEALAKELGASGVVVCPAFPSAGRMVYQGHLFVGDTLLSESGMQHHPLTPMKDPDIRRWLSYQTTAQAGHVALSKVREGVQALRASLIAGRHAHKLIVADAITDDDLITIGKACAGAKLITGGSGVAMALPRNFQQAGLLVPAHKKTKGISGPAAVLAGSCSGATRGQVDVFAKRNPSYVLDVAAVMAGTVSAHTVLDFIADHGTAVPLIYSSTRQIRCVPCRNSLELKRWRRRWKTCLPRLPLH